MGEAMENRQLFYVGSFAQHINVIEFDRLTENISLVNRILGEPQPVHMQISSDGTLLYCANEYMEGTGGVRVYRLDDPKAPEQISFWASDTEGPAYISIAEDGRWLLGAGYFDGRVQAWPIDPDGGVRRCECTIQHVGDGPFSYEAYISKQDHARAHCAVPIPGSDLFVCADLGMDMVYIYRLRAGNIQEVSRLKMRLGTGPRHIAVHQNGEILYMIDELSSHINVLALERSSGEIQVLQRVCALPDDFTGISWASAIHISTDGKYLYAANRGHESLAIFEILDDGRRLASKGWFRQEMANSRDFCFDATGEYALICSLDSDAVTLNRVNRQTGGIEFLQKLTGVIKPASILPANDKPEGK